MPRYPKVTAAKAKAIEADLEKHSGTLTYRQIAKLNDVSDATVHEVAKGADGRYAGLLGYGPRPGEAEPQMRPAVDGGARPVDGTLLASQLDKALARLDEVGEGSRAAAARVGHVEDALEKHAGATWESLDGIAKALRMQARSQMLLLDAVATVGEMLAEVNVVSSNGMRVSSAGATKAHLASLRDHARSTVKKMKGGGL